MKHSSILKSIAVILLLLTSLLTMTSSYSLAQEKNDSRKVSIIRKKADNNFEHFNYVHAIKHYKKILHHRPEDTHSTLRIADSYRRMGKPEEARVWYGIAEDKGIITEKEDIINYANVLSAVGEYDHSKSWYEAHGIEGERAGVVAAKVAALDNMDQFFEDTTAYYLENVSFNTEFSDFGPSYGHGGVVFSSARPASGLINPKYNWDGSNFLDLYYVKDNESAVEEISRGINTRYHEGPATFYDNDTKVIFTRNNYNKGVAGQSGEGVNTLHLFYADRESKNEKWTNVNRLWFNTDDHSYGHPTITADGKTMYFASDMTSSLGGSDIFQSDFIEGKWSKPKNLGLGINTEGNEFFPFIHEEGILYFASDGLHGIGGLDIYQFDLRDPDAKPKNMGYPINTPLDDFGIILDSAGLTGYLASSRDGGKGHDDIYYFEKYEYEVKAILVDAETNQPIKGNLKAKFLDVWGKDKRIETDQKMSFRIIKGRQFMLAGTAEDYQPNDSLFVALSLDTARRTIEVRLPLVRNLKIVKDLISVVNNGVQTQLFIKTDHILEEYQGSLEALKEEFETQKITVGSIFTYENIYYDFDQSNIREDASQRLDKISALLKQYPDLKIALQAHTDIRGSGEYNHRLAKKRVKNAQKYLTTSDISKKRITTNSFGEEQLHNDCISNCDEVKHQSNRRTEIRLFY